MSENLNVKSYFSVSKNQNHIDNVNQINTKEKKEYNLGIGVLRVILSFMVVFDHFYSKKKKKRFLYCLYYHIPTFFLISFYFTYKTLISFNINKIKIRLERLLIPYFSWCIISWIINIIYYYIFKKESNYSLKVFIINLINGHILNVVLWFQNILILTTFLFLIIIFIFRNNYFLILNALGLFCYILQYSGINYKFFIKKVSIHFRLTYGRFAEAFPNALTGFFLASIDIIQKCTVKKQSVIIFSLIILIIISKYKVFSGLKTFKYGGIRLNIAAICIFLIFSLIPFQTIKFNIFIKIIMHISNYTGGIYFIHHLVGDGYLCKSISLLKKYTFFRCIIIFFISYILSFIGMKIFKKTKFRHLFA